MNGITIIMIKITLRAFLAMLYKLFMKIVRASYGSGTADGLNRVNRPIIDTKLFYFDRITTYEGLPNNTIYGILEDKEHQLWISTNLGLVKYKNNTAGMDVFRRSDGLSSDEFNLGAYFSDNGERLYFGSVEGMSVVNHFASETKVEKSRILFTHAKVDERELDIYQLNHSDNPSITQQHDEAAIDISVANINFNKLGTQRYRYRIIGFDNEWKYLDTQRSMVIVGLPGGSYQLDVQSQLGGNVWSSEMKRLDINV